MLDVKKIMSEIVAEQECLSMVKEKAFEYAMSHREKFIEFCGEEFWKQIVLRYPEKVHRHKHHHELKPATHLTEKWIGHR